MGALNGEEVQQLGGTANAAHSSSSLQTPPALLHRDPNPVSAVVCVDLGYAFVARPVSRAGGVLAVPADDLNWTNPRACHDRLLADPG